MGTHSDCIFALQVARILHLIYRLVVQPNASRSHSFADTFISSGGLETLLLLLQKEAKSGEDIVVDNLKVENTENSSVSFGGKHAESLEEMAAMSHNDFGLESIDCHDTRMSTDTQLLRSLGGLNFSINAESSKNSLYSVDNGDGIIVGVISLLGALVMSGHLKLSSSISSPKTSINSSNIVLTEDGSNMLSDKISLLLFAIEQAFQAAPLRLMTTNVYSCLLGAAVLIRLCEVILFEFSFILHLKIGYFFIGRGKNRISDKPYPGLR